VLTAMLGNIHALPTLQDTYIAINNHFRAMTSLPVGTPCPKEDVIRYRSLSESGNGLLRTIRSNRINNASDTAAGARSHPATYRC
jgi:hypothetical protein